ncbi:MAG: tRNA lysidine(34) synthetase TilS [Syntrophobacteria bacterium]
MLKKVRNTVVAHRMLQPGDRVLVGVSGGPDSVALCHLLHGLRHDLNIDLVIAHVHHGLREAEADEDARFVQDLGKHLALPVVVRHLNMRTWLNQHGGSVQTAAHTLRYQSLYQVMAQQHTGKLALGHNADDQAEEVLLRLFRGSGQRGLTGMPACSREGIIRPLLECSRNEILAYLESHGLAFRQDASNLRPWCQRNLLRLELLPRLRHCFNSNIDATLLRTAKIFQEEEDFWESLLQCWLKRYACTGGSMRLPIAPLLETHPAMQRRLLRRAVEEVRGNLKRFGFRHTEILLRLCRSSRAGGQIHLPGRLVAEKNYGWLTLSREQPACADFHYEIPGIGIYPLPALNRCLEVQCLDRPGVSRFSRDPCDVVVDRDLISFPLSLTPSKSGDRFRPLGLGGSKKIKDFLMDVKVPRRERGRIPVLRSGDCIVWVVGYRLDDRVKITPDTRRLLRLWYREQEGQK